MTTPPDADALTTSIRKVVAVPQPTTAAFELFFGDMAAWWPMETHSVGGRDAARIEVEPVVGGRIFEVSRGGAATAWATIVEWDPPTRVRMQWYPGRTQDEATDLELTFTPLEDGGTRVELVHAGWERLADGREMQPRYNTGWDGVLGRYVAAA